MESARTFKDRLPYFALGAMILAVVASEWRQIKTARAIPRPLAVGTAPAKHIAAEGRLVTYPGAEVTIGAEIDGKIEKLSVKERDRVTTGQLLAEIDVDEQRAALQEARARVKEAGADSAYLERERRRADALFTGNAIPAALREKSVHEAEIAAQHRLALLATAARASTIIDKAKVSAPRGGTVIARFVDEGEMVRAGDSLLTIADLDAVRIEAEVSEFDATRVRLNQAVNISAEGSENETWRGRVEEIPDMVVPRKLKPLDPSRPVDTRVLLVKIELDGKVPLKLGQRVEVEFVP